jgi:hypothetical protein
MEIRMVLSLMALPPTISILMANEALLTQERTEVEQQNLTCRNVLSCCRRSFGSCNVKTAGRSIWSQRQRSNARSKHFS